MSADDTKLEYCRAEVKAEKNVRAVGYAESQTRVLQLKERRERDSLALSPAACPFLSTPHWLGSPSSVLHGSTCSMYE